MNKYRRTRSNLDPNETIVGNGILVLHGDTRVHLIVKISASVSSVFGMLVVWWLLRVQLHLLLLLQVIQRLQPPDFSLQHSLLPCDILEGNNISFVRRDDKWKQYVVEIITLFDHLLLRDALKPLPQSSVFHRQDHILLFHEFKLS